MIRDDDQRLLGHPAGRLDRDARCKVVPMRLHGDGVPIGKKKKRSLKVISISSLTGSSGATWDTRWILSAMVDGAEHKEDDGESTEGVLWDVLAWSFAVLASGVWPRTNWNGDPWTDWRKDKTGRL